MAAAVAAGVQSSRANAVRRACIGGPRGSGADYGTMACSDDFR